MTTFLAEVGMFGIAMGVSFLFFSLAWFIVGWFSDNWK